MYLRRTLEIFKRPLIKKKFSLGNKIRNNVVAPETISILIRIIVIVIND